jgi:hypothetical protein
MGMNAQHREMEAVAPKNSPLSSMARLTWWKHNEKEGFYENVISQRRIPAAKWKKADEAFVHLEDKDGNSSIDDFIPEPPSMPPGTNSQLAVRTRGMEAKEKKTAASAATQDPAPTSKALAKETPTPAAANSKHKDAPSTPPQKPSTGPGTPPKPKAATSTTTADHHAIRAESPPRSKANTSTTTTGKPNTAPTGSTKLPAAAATAATGKAAPKTDSKAGSSSQPKTKAYIINGKTCPATYHDGKWWVTFRGSECQVDRAPNRSYKIQYKGQDLEAKDA